VSRTLGNPDRVLIANRGEIARRVIRSCRRLGLEAVAVYSEADAASAHVEEADRAFCIGKPRAQESYLLAEPILAAARSSGAGLVHPGYGFLSENAAFARAVAAAGLVWIGPDPDQIAMMGDKERAREAAMDAGVPVLPGSTRFAEGGLAGIEDAARAVGFPLLVKAAAGGGGIGMRRADAPDRLLEVAAATQSMAARAFGDGAIYLERYVPQARHVEIQVFGFGDGRAIHLFERDCSVQRRFQKVIEECAAPGLPAALTRRMAETAVALARAVEYAGAGTVEYVVDADTLEFFFLEMNTRIQVEHPVTEMVTGADLVAMQIELARGRLDPPDQDAVVRKGCAIECRLYAENPARMFMPSPGLLEVFRLPPQSDTVRIDSGYREGDQVTPYYDPLVAKIIAWGQDRAAAIAHAADALKSTQVEGIRTNREFLVACLEDSVFASGRATTRFIDERGRQLLEAAGLAARRA
jgi:3-methylcrotonyl-CoA carboxylase alpha subunit